MNMKRFFKIVVLFWLGITLQATQAAQISLNFVKRTAPLGRFPSVQLDWLILTAKNFEPQLPEVQNAVAEIVQNSYTNFKNFNTRTQNKLLKVYRKLLTSPLLGTAQKAFLSTTIIPAITPLVQPLSPEVERAQEATHLQQMQTILTQTNLSSPTAVETIANKIAQTEANVDAASVTNPAIGQSTPTAQLPQENMVTPTLAQPEPRTALPQENPVTIAQPTKLAPLLPAPLPLAQQETIATTTSTASSATLPATTPVSSETVTAIMQDPMKTTATKAVELATVISATPTQVKVDSETSNVVAGAVQDLFNTQTPGDAPHIAKLLTATTEKPVLTPEQNTYVSTTLIPATQEAVASATAAGISTNTVQSTPITTAALSSTAAIPSLSPAVPLESLTPTTLLPTLASTIPNAENSAFSMTSAIPLATNSQAPLGMDLEQRLRMLYEQMQNAQGGTFDQTVHASFGASLVETFNKVLDTQSYALQVLQAAMTTPLLNEAQHQYVRDTMLPNLDNVSATTPTKKLGAKTKKLKTKKGKKTAKIPGAKKGKKKKSKKAQAASTPVNGLSTEQSSTTQATQIVAKKGKKKLKKAATAKQQAKKKKKKKKLKKAATPSTTPTQTASV